MAKRTTAKNNLLALGSAAVLTVYAAGYERTRAAAERFAESERRRPTVPAPAGRDTTPVVPAPESPRRVVDSVPPPAVAATPVAKPRKVAAAKRDTTVDSAKAVDTTTVVAAAAPPPVRDSLASPPDSAADSTAKASPKEQYKDGVYFGWGTSRHGDIQAGIEIKNGRITSAFISECLTQYSCSWIVGLPPQVVARQSAEVDYVSGATQSTNAFYYAVVEALKKAK
jgi:uncharacterized protein with FMN-binding domain